MSINYEKLGVFYLGKSYDLQEKKVIKDEFTLYRSKDLKTHAVCLGMTGSGKTGLCISLLEEAAMDNVPIIAIDPKGDISNLLLGFENMESKDFLPWIQESEAAQKGYTLEELAEKKSQIWSQGIRDWDQTEERIKQIKKNVDMRIYTPGDDSGLQLSLFGSFRFPGDQTVEDPSALAEAVESQVSSFLSLIDSNMSEVGAPEHTFLSQIVMDCWQKKETLSLPALIGYVQNPPFDKVGVLDLESFFPQNKRQALALKLNSLFASPKFKTWSKGEPLNISSLLYKDKKPQVSIISISHLSEEERIFFVSRLLNELVSWVRKQSGTSSLRALLYMDEIYGYFPPQGNPATKKPMLTLLKQARAQGLGVVLATQNPVDLDYKGLSNTGTWFIGRLQTERDKARLLEGLKSIDADADFDLDEVLSSLDKRVFLMHNVHAGAPEIFHTRWALSYLGGPITQDQIGQLMEPYKKTYSPIQTKPLEEKFNPKTLPKEIEQKMYDRGDLEQLKPVLGAVTSTHYTHSSSGLNKSVKQTWYADLSEEVLESLSEFSGEDQVDVSGFETHDKTIYNPVPSFAVNADFFKDKKKEIINSIYRSEGLTLYKCPTLKSYSQAEENKEEFTQRLSTKLREKRDEQVEKIKDRFEKKISTVEKRILRTEQKIEKEEEQYKNKKMGTLINFGTALASVLMGGKSLSSTSVSKAGRVIRSASSASREKGDIARAQAQLTDYQQDLQELQDEMEDQVMELEDKLSLDQLEVEEFKVSPKKSSIEVRWTGILWVPPNFL